MLILNIINVFTVPLKQFNESLLQKRFYLFIFNSRVWSLQVICTKYVNLAV